MLNFGLTSSPKRSTIESIDTLETFQSDLIFINLKVTDKAECGLPSHNERWDSSNWSSKCLAYSLGDLSKYYFGSIPPRAQKASLINSWTLSCLTLICSTLIWPCGAILLYTFKASNYKTYHPIHLFLHDQSIKSIST